MAKSSKPTQDAPVQSPTEVDPTRVAAHDQYGHGHSLAAWSAVGVVIFGSLLACLGVVFANVPLAIVGGVIAVLGGPLGKVLGAMGFGSGSQSTR